MPVLCIKKAGGRAACLLPLQTRGSYKVSAANTRLEQQHIIVRLVTALASFFSGQGHYS